MAESLIYQFDKDRHTVTELPDKGTWYISVDYGTLNPFSAGLWCVNDGRAVRVAEYYYSGRGTNRQLTDEEYYAKLEKLAGDRRRWFQCISRCGAYHAGCWSQKDFHAWSLCRQRSNQQ